MAQLVKQTTLDLCSGHDLIVPEIKSCFGFCADGVEPAWVSLSPSLSLSLTHSHMFVLSLSLKIIINDNNNKL